MPSLSFHGGAGTVTGSRFLVETDAGNAQVDCGLFQGLKELRLLNWRRPAYEPAAVDDVLLTHAHVDHSGWLPRFVREGFGGRIHCTAATRDLAEVLLLDAAKIQEQDAEYANRKGFSKHHPALPLYTSEDAERALERFVPVDWNAWLELANGMRARFHNAGHILGAAMVELRVPTRSGALRLLFSGDVGRYGAPLHLDPSPPPDCDVLVMESTYGDRLHEHEPLEDQVAQPFAETFARGGSVLIPAFAVGRAQLLTLLLRDLMEAGKLQEVPIHVDSPMAVDATRIYSRYLDARHLDAELLTDRRQRLFPRRVHLHRSVEDSKRLNELEGPRIIISSSGMLSGGRVLHHLRRLLPDPRHLVALAGYQAAGTRGRRLLEGESRLRIHGRDVPVRARFLALSGLSAHADRDELLRWARAAGRAPERVFVVHGEPEAAQSFARLLEHELGWRTQLPHLGDRFELEPRRD